MAGVTASPFVLCKVRHNVSLSPCHALEPRVGIEQDMTELLMRYSEDLAGVVLSFSKVQLAQPYGAIVNEAPFIHCKVVADALVFRPEEGMRLRGVVNKIGSNHVGMLFAGVFNGSVSETELPQGYVHNYAQDCWLAADGSSIAVNDEVDVKVLRVHVAGGMIAIEATMRIKGAKPLSKADKSPAKKVKKAKKKATLDLSADVEEDVSVEEPKKSKAKKSKDSKKRKHVVEELEAAVVPEEEAPVEAEVEVKPKKHKHKDMDGKKKKKKQKQSKHE